MFIGSFHHARRASAASLILLLVAGLAWAGGRPRSKSYDTDGDGTNDVAIRETDTNGDGIPDVVHIDCNGNGVVDANEIVIRGNGPKGVNWGGGGGWNGIKIHVTADTGTETTKAEFKIQDLNGDGDTCDPGEIVPQ